jgi:hypothetical protein
VKRSKPSMARSAWRMQRTTLHPEKVIVVPAPEPAPVLGIYRDTFYVGPKTWERLRAHFADTRGALRGELQGSVLYGLAGSPIVVSSACAEYTTTTHPLRPWAERMLRGARR